MNARQSLRNGLMLVAGLWAGQVLAWGQQGTALVGELTQRQLTPEAKAEAGRLLGLIKQSDFAVVANWAGNLDQNPQTKELWQQTKNQRLVIYKADDCTFQLPRDCPDGVCSVAAIERNRAALADPKAPNQTRLMALLFLIHHTSDASSPLNNSFKDDKGGYDFPVKAGGKTYNLRQVWDDFLLGSAKLDVKAYADKLQKGLPAADSDNPAQWSQQACQIVRDGGIYPQKAEKKRKLPTHRTQGDDDSGDIDYAAKNIEYNRSGKDYSRGDKLMNEKPRDGAGDGIDGTYMSTFVPVAEKQVQLASARLARLLNAALVAGRPAS
ncbi:S1/P1 nuclease [Pseudomonas sp. Marseille-P9899]|uniref:S1/P1 nuclease n=1 Tax=Pseudomonas sp. Marseille-P9899 TaxID=2730401 RepID=UPI00158C2395|nr:S1/P1 nuclease [Pseudomonas sp. Marseille-P9899]